MSALTSLTPLPYPEATDQPFIHLDMQALAEATAEALPVVATTTTRPPHRLGRQLIETNSSSRRTYISTGTSWLATSDPTAERRTLVPSGKINNSAAFGSTTLTAPYKCSIYAEALLSVGFATADAEVGATWQTTAGDVTLSSATNARTFVTAAKWGVWVGSTLITNVDDGETVTFRLLADIATVDTAGAYVAGAIRYHLVPVA